MEGKEGFWLFDSEHGHIRATRGGWDGENYKLNENNTVDLTYKVLE